MVLFVVDSSTGDLAHSRSPTRGYLRPLLQLLKHTLAPPRSAGRASFDMAYTDNCDILG